MTLSHFLRLSLSLFLLPFMLVGAVVAILSYALLVLPWLKIIDDL